MADVLKRWIPLGQLMRQAAEKSGRAQMSRPAQQRPDLLRAIQQAQDAISGSVARFGGLAGDALARRTGYREGDATEAAGRLAEALRAPIPFGTMADLDRAAALRMAPGSLRPNLTEDEMVNEGLNVVGMAPVGMTVWHGSPHKFDRFDMSKIGTGEGAQAYGHGLYMAEARDVGEEYAKKLGNANAILYLDGKPYTYDMYQSLGDADRLIAQEFEGLPKNWRTKNELLDSLKSRSKGAFKNWKPIFKEAIEKVKSEAVSLDAPQNLYKVDIPDEAVARMLDWDKPLSEQAPEVQAAFAHPEISGIVQSLKSSGRLGDYSPQEMQSLRGEDWYDMLRQANDDSNVAPSNYLMARGIPGIRYLDGGSRASGEGTSNFVLFDDQLPRIIERNGEPSGLQPWAPGEANALIGLPTLPGASTFAAPMAAGTIGAAALMGAEDADAGDWPRQMYQQLSGTPDGRMQLAGLQFSAPDYDSLTDAQKREWASIAQIYNFGR